MNEAKAALAEARQRNPAIHGQMDDGAYAESSGSVRRPPKAGLPEE